jgi:glutathione S-transferase
MAPIELFVAPLCPFAMRARLVLAEKALPVSEIELDPRRMPARFLKLSPNGKVPLLLHNEQPVWEAAVIGEYLEEVFPEPPLLPKSPHARAKARAWVNFADTRLYAKTETLLHSPDPGVHVRIGALLADELRVLEARALADPARDGPYWLGAEFTLADLAFYPWFEQLSVLERFRGFRAPAECRTLFAWRDAVAAREAIRAIARPPEFYLEGYGRLAAALAAA